jgi:cytoskeletal protein CcmA (bactofilin family)
MSQYPNSPDLGNQSQSGDSVFENVWVFGKLNYPFEQDDLKIRSIDVSEPSFFKKSVTLSGDLNLTGNAAIVGDVSLDELDARNANFTGIVTTSGDLYVSGRFRDVNSATGSAGQILSSTGNGVDWIDANTTSVNNSINVGVNVDSTNADQFVSFFGANSGNQPNRVDNDFKYNPSTNLLKIDGTAGGIVPSGAIILWSGAANAIPTGYALCDGNNNTPDLRNRFVVGAGSGSNYSVNDTGGADSVTLTVNQIPAHTHTYIDQYVAINNGYRPWPANNNDCAARDVNSGSAGGGQSHENRPPYYALCFIMKT